MIHEYNEDLCAENETENAHTEHKMINKDDLRQIVYLLNQRYLERTGHPARTVILVGGSAMMAHGIKDESKDIDIYCKDEGMIAIAREIEAETGFMIDITSDKDLWNSDIIIHDIEEDAQLSDKFVIKCHYNHDGSLFDSRVAAVSPETLFVIKAMSMRDQDRDDMLLLSKKTTPIKIMNRAATLLAKDASKQMEAADILSLLISEIQLGFNEIFNSEWLKTDPPIKDKTTLEIIGQAFLSSSRFSKRPPPISTGKAASLNKPQSML